MPAETPVGVASDAGAQEGPCPRFDLPAPDVAEATMMAALLADRTRAGILVVLRDGPHCVCELAATFAERESNVSNHLAKLREAGLVRASRHALTHVGGTTSATRTRSRTQSRRSTESTRAGRGYHARRLHGVL